MLKRRLPASVVRVALILSTIAFLALLIFDRPAVIPLHATGSFSINGEYPSQFTTLVFSERLASWSGSDANTGSLRSDEFTAPAAVVLAVAGHPSHPGERLALHLSSTNESRPLLNPQQDPGETWRYFIIPVDQAWQGKRVWLEAVDNGTGWGDWIGVAGLRPARIDERLLGVPMLSRWAYVGVAYLAVMIFGIVVTIRSAPIPEFDPLWLGGCLVVGLLARTTGWTSVDLSGWFATWGRDALLYGPASLYNAPWQSDNPPLNPTQMVVPALLEALFRVPDSKFDAFLFKLIPVASLVVLPFLVNACMRAAGVKTTAKTFRWIVIATVFNPALIYSTAIWGQTDVYASDIILAAFVAFVTCRPGLGSMLYTAGILLKPQPILAIPVMAVLAIRSNRILWVIGGIFVSLIAVLPSTYPHGGLFLGYAWLVNIFTHAANEYSWATLGAGTLPAILSGSNGGLVEDQAVNFFGLSLRLFSTASVLVVMGVLFYAAWRERAKLGSPLGLWYLATSCMLIYWTASHMHERYITYAAICAIVWAFARATKISTGAAAALTAALLLQMLLNWSIDLGWGKNVPDTFLQVAPRWAYAAVYTTLNVIGLGLLLASRAATDESAELFARKLFATTTKIRAD